MGPQFEKPSDQLTRGLVGFVLAKKSLLRCDDLLPLLAQFLDPERHNVAGFQEHRRGLHAEARRRAGDDDVARLHHEYREQYPNTQRTLSLIGIDILSLQNMSNSRG